VDERIQNILKLQESSYKHEPRQSTVLGNFYAIITIATVCISILYYVQYVQPIQKEKALQKVQLQKQQQISEERAKRIALSHKLNARDYNATK